MAKCIRCGKTCGSGENMCDECKVWFKEKTGGSVVSGVNRATPKKDNKTNVSENKPIHVSEPPKQDTQEISETKDVGETTSGKDVPTTPISGSSQGKNIVLSRKTLYLIIAGIVAVVVIVILVIAMSGKDKNNDVIRKYSHIFFTRLC